LKKLSIPRLCFELKEFALFLFIELRRALSGKNLGNESRRGLGIGSILFTIHHPLKSPLDP
jgi:hypothetical protein